MSITFLDESNIKQGLGDDERSVISQKAMTDILSEFTTDGKAHLSPTGDQTDRTSEIISMLTDYGVCYLDSGEFYVTQINMPESSAIIGCGESSTLVQIARTDETGERAVINLGNHCSISNVNILGQLRTRPAEIEIDNPDYAIKLDIEEDVAQTCKIENTTIRGFSGAGIYVYDTGYGPLRSVLVSNVEIKNCGAGIYTGYHGEYGCYSNVICVDNYIGCYNNGGNNKFVNCGFDRNCYGMYMTSGDVSSPNNGHGTCTGCTFNHNVYSAIYAHTVIHGFMIDSCQMFHNGSAEYPSIHLLNSNGIVISNTQMGGNINYPIIVKMEAIEGKYQNNTAILTDCLFHYLPQIYVGDSCTLQIDGCYMLDGTSITRENLKTVQGNIIALQNFESNKYEFTCSNSTLEDLSTEIITMCGKNLLKNIALDKTSQGITFAKSNTGVSVVGTATANSFYNPNVDFYLPAGNYHLSGCPKGGSSTKYALRVQKIENGVTTLLGSDYGDGLDFTVPEGVTLNVFIVVFSGQTVDLNFTPMIELASVVTGEFEAYKELQCNVDATGKIVTSEYFNPISVFYGTNPDTTITMTYLQTTDETGITNLIATKVSNAVEGHISGEIISISDMSPIQHNISAHLYTKDLVIPNETTFIFPNGYTATLNDDGSVTVSGSANTTESINLSIALRKRDGTYNSIPLEAGQKYRLHFYKDGEISVRGRLKITDSNGANSFKSVTAWNEEDELVAEERSITNIYVDSSGQAIGDTSLCGTYKAVLEKDLSVVSVLEYGKNLVPYPFNETTKTVNGITFIDNGDGTVTANGTATADAAMYLFATSYNPIKLSKGMYVLSGCPVGGDMSTYSISIGTSADTIARDAGNGSVFTISEELSNSGVGVSIKILSGTTVTGLVFKPQIELGAIATEFEEYLAPTTYTSTEYGIVEDIPSHYPTMTLRTNTEGVLVDVQYNKDVNAEFEQLNHRPLITFIDDDGQQEQLDNWEEIDDLTGVKPTIAVVTSRPLDVADASSRYPSWDNIQRLTSRGFEFISHTDNHQNLTECDATTIETELSTSLSTLQEHGINPKFVVYPYNAYNDEVIDCVRKYYKGAVTCEYQTNIAPINDFAIKRQSFTATSLFDKTFDDGTTRTVYKFRADDELRQMVDEAAAKNGWIIFMTHLRNYDVYYYDNDIKTKLVSLIEYAKAKGLKPVSLNEGYELMKDRREQISSSNVSYSRFIDEKEVDAKIISTKSEFIGTAGDSADTSTINGAKAYTREMLVGVASEEYVDEQFNQLSELKADKTAISTPYTFKGTTTFSALPTANNAINDTYFCTDKNCKYTWNGSGWYQSSLIETQYVDRLNYIDEELSNFISNISEYDEQLFELDKWINGSLYYGGSTTVWENMSTWRRYPAFSLEAGTYFVKNIHASFFNLKFANGTITSLTDYDNWVPFSSNGEAANAAGYFTINQSVTVYASTNKWENTTLSRKRIPDNIGYVEGVYALQLRPDVVNYSINDIKIENILLGNLETMNSRGCGSFEGYPITFVQTHTGSGNTWWEIGFDASTSKRGFIRVDVNISAMSGAAKLFLFGNSTSGSSLIIPIQDIKETGRHIMDIDLNFYVVYHDLVLDNNVRVGIANHTNEFTCTYDKINVYDLSTDLDTDKNLNDNLSDMMIQIQSNTNNINSLKERSSATILIAPNGEKYIIQVGENGAVTSTPKIPKNILYIGNSLLIGWGTFGMAASNSSSDYYYYVNQYLQNLGVDLTANKLKGTGFEGCTSATEQATWYNDTLLPTLNNDIDLVIVQLGDNVNTAEKLAVFEQGTKDLVTYIRTNAPRARVAWVGEWYSSTAKQTYIANACAERGADFIDISDLIGVSGYCANIGDVITKDDGTTVTIDSSGVASHPSSKGMKAVADRIINALFK